jgi:glucokinase
MKYAIGIDLGGTDVKVIAADENGEILERHSTLSWGVLPPAFKAPQPRAGVPELETVWQKSIRRTVAQYEQKQGTAAAAIGVAAPGLVAPDGRSIAILPGRLEGLVGLDWTAFLQREEMVPVLNDAQAALVGEAWRGAAASFRHVILLTLGTGVGGAIMADGKLLRGAIGRAGHFGHVSISESPETSIAGTPGALELAIGNCTIIERGGFSLAHGGLNYPSTLALIKAHRAGDARATEIWSISVRALGRALVGFINILDPEAIIIGGGIARAADDLFRLLAEELDKFEWRPGGHRVQILPAALGEWAGALGAAKAAFDHDSDR